ncbi:hypothetical protein IGS68_27005 [Skermanella sp. TT6]|uniref:SHOCT domain-containing protein n=1 Tax=Skermanella cutis TaxID=2775420 RepID=A0ABX7B5E1_9PROT|nr:hypothetical protein [Skermanella sp. TT6]QQP89574.1 hypothetical protein IGS68_27005 [Skermanella sp. TT6]
MRNLTSEGQARIAEIARRHGISTDGAMTMLDALVRGGGTMAQFNHPDFGGSGQWMMGGMTMVSDLFNNALKARVDNVCVELSNLLANDQGWLWEPMPAQSQSQFSQPSSSLSGSFGGWNSGSWWPAELGQPNSSGGQNDIRYAYFGHANRLAVDIAGTVTVYDTGDHMISGVSQQQGNGWTVTFTSQYGTVPVSSLRVVGGAGEQSAPAPISTTFQEPAPMPAAPVAASGSAALEQDYLSGSTWTFGPAGGEPFGLVTLSPEGGIAGDVHPRARFWSVENGVLSFYDADGRTSVRFSALAPEGAAATIRGDDPSAPGQDYVLRSPAAREVAPPPPASAPAALPIPVDLSAGEWALEDASGQILATLRLMPDQSIAGGRPTEARWRTDGDTLVLLHGSGRPTARFDTFQFRAGRWSLAGSLQSDPGIALTLRQT